MVWHGIIEVLVCFSAKDTILDFLGNICTIFLAISGTDICCMYNCFEMYSSHADSWAKDVHPTTISLGHSESQTKALICITWLSNVNGISIQKCDSTIPALVCI